MEKNENQLEILSITSQKLFGEDFFSPDKVLTEEEILVRNFIERHRDKNRYKIRVQEPIPDYIVFEDNMNFLSKLPNDVCDLYLDFPVFSQKVKYYENLGYDEIYFSFVELNDTLLNSISNSDDKDALAKFKNELYIIVKFKQTLNNIVKNYFLFNVRYAERDSKFISDKMINDFSKTTTALKLKNISKSNYLTCEIKYDLAKVSKYMDTLNKYCRDFNTDIIKIGFTYCLGEKPSAKDTKEAFYLVSLPIDHRGSLSFFPYYDQGSLEP
ncbi:hypothetical protein [Chryseobacterium sp. S90]|uniref:hypothetical protein n=1 Tax=Chryseobacterium sp. S90 TaxID=3395373 RepID=UPI0039BD7A4C